MRTAIVLVVLALSGCNVAPPPPSQSAAPAKPAEDHQLRDAIQAPIDRAESANDPNVKADEERDKALEDAGG